MWHCYRFYKFKLLPFVDLLKAEYILQTGLAEVALFHLQDCIGLNWKGADQQSANIAVKELK